MSFLNKTFALTKDENFKEFVETLPVPEDKRELLINFKPTQTLKKDGDEYTLNITTPGGGSKDLKFKAGVEFDEDVALGIVAKAKFTVEGNEITQNLTFEDGRSVLLRREFSGDQLVVVITSNKWDGTARRYYKAV